MHNKNEEKTMTNQTENQLIKELEDIIKDTFQDDLSEGKPWEEVANLIDFRKTKYGDIVMVGRGEGYAEYGSTLYGHADNGTVWIN